MYRIALKIKPVIQDWLLIFALLSVVTPSFAVSPAPLPPPGHDLILSGRCDEFAKTAGQYSTARADDHFAFTYRWAQLFSRLAIYKRLECLSHLSPQLQYNILLHSVTLNGPEPDLQLIEAWYVNGGDLNLVRTETRNLATAVLYMGRTLPLLRLKSFGLKPMNEMDTGNELTAASKRFEETWHIGEDHKSIDEPPLEWLLANGYSWPLDAGAAHELLSNLVRMKTPRLARVAIGHYTNSNTIQKIKDFDSNKAERPLIYSVQSVDALNLIHKLGFNVHAQHVERITGRVYLNSALEVAGLSSDLQLALLNLNVSVTGRKNQPISPLYAALAGQVDLEVVERYLQAGAPLYVYSISQPDGSSVQTSAMHFVAEFAPTKLRDRDLQILIRIFTKYGASAYIEHDGSTHALKLGNLPIHSAIDVRLDGPYKPLDWQAHPSTFSTWLQESRIKPDIKHSKHHISLLGYAIRRSTGVNLDRLYPVVYSLIAAGAPVNPVGESLLVEHLKVIKKPDLTLLSKLLELGADPNRIDGHTKSNALTHLLLAPTYRSSNSTCPSWMRQSNRWQIDCVDETEAERLDLLRWFVRRGADPKLKDGSGRSALDIADALTKPEKREVFRNALTLGASQ